MVNYWLWMVNYLPRMVKYWTSDGEILAPKVLASRYVNSGPEMLPEKLENRSYIYKPFIKSPQRSRRQ